LSALKRGDVVQLVGLLAGHPVSVDAAAGPDEQPEGYPEAPGGYPPSADDTQRVLGAHQAFDGVTQAFGAVPGTQTDKVVEFGEWLSDRTAGQPFYLLQAMQMLLVEEVLRVRPVGDGGWAIEVPDIIEAEHDKRLDSVVLSGLQTLSADRPGQLSESEGDLPAAAVPRGRFTEQRLGEVASVDEDAALCALDLLVQQRVLRELRRTSAASLLTA
jgi:hypothetical protein